MSKERLEDIKHEYDFLGVIHRSEHIEWLIKQAERVQELEETVEDYKTVNKELHQRGRKVSNKTNAIVKRWKEFRKKE